MSETDAVLFANEAFYRAFTDRDPAAMEAAWSAAEDISCIHPGWAPLLGRAEVLRSWLSILANPQSPSVTARQPRAFVNGDHAYVICYEEIAGEHLIATNLFRLEAEAEGGRGRPRWRLVHHQSGPTQGSPEDTGEEHPGRPN